ncbi:UNVERIFIED_CONTAM: GDSL esterase/lipase EXL2 [Sesamum radiatum]|uniref:GDSL esterase/lipase EXL2 n=1 Tax=Sesamum radiatum TaxID=300843 RepID=A0AAW2M324_SESRA
MQFLLFKLLFAFLVCIAEAVTTMPQNSTIPAVIVFGDSVVDTGNNNYIETVIKVNYPPYGKDFIGGRPTGRFCDGRVPSDLIVEELGIKDLLPAYFDPTLHAQDLLTGVNFASGGAGYDPLTSILSYVHSLIQESCFFICYECWFILLATSNSECPHLFLQSVLSLSDQLRMFKDYTTKLELIAGHERTSTILQEGLFIVVAGSNDITNTYFGTPLRKSHYDVSSYTDLLVAYASNFVQELYKLGARRIGVFGLPPLGCLPSQRTLKGGAERKCIDIYNQVAELFNNKLSAEVDSINSRYPEARVVYIDIYNLPLDLIRSPQKYGFKFSDKGCCGTGTIEVAFLCKYTCSDVSDYVFWDSFHLTEKAYRLLVHQILKKSIRELL